MQRPPVGRALHSVAAWLAQPNITSGTDDVQADLNHAVPRRSRLVPLIVNERRLVEVGAQEQRLQRLVRRAHGRDTTVNDHLVEDAVLGLAHLAGGGVLGGVLAGASLVDEATDPVDGAVRQPPAAAGLPDDQLDHLVTLRYGRNRFGRTGLSRSGLSVDGHLRPPPFQHAQPLGVNLFLMIALQKSNWRKVYQCYIKYNARYITANSATHHSKNYASIRCS